nr:hypothetical protein [Rhodoblastus acidophilus]
MNDLIEPRRSSRSGRQHVVVKALGEDATAAENDVAMKATRQNDQQQTRSALGGRSAWQ